MRRFLILLLAFAALAVPASAGGLEVGKAGAEFEVTTPDRKKVTLKGLLAEEGTKAVVVEFAGLECPFTMTADRKFVPLMKKYAARGVRGIALFPNGADRALTISSYSVRIQTPYLVARDPGAKIATTWGVATTPTFLVFDGSGTLRFRGTSVGLPEALEAILAGKKVTTTSSPEVGCTIRPEEPRAEELPPRKPGEGLTKVPVPELTAEGQKWLGLLIEKIESEDVAVARSARAAILAIGPSALPHLRRVREGSKGPTAVILDDLIRGILNPARKGARPNRFRAGGPERDTSMLEMQLRAIARLIDVSDEQLRDLRLAFVELRPIEDKIREDTRSGTRRAGAKRMQALIEKSQEVVKRILTEEQWKRWQGMRRTRRDSNRKKPAEGGAREPETDGGTREKEEKR